MPAPNSRSPIAASRWTGKSTFSYDGVAVRLIYDSGRLLVGRHAVRITATDEAGNTYTRTWTFRVITG
jgi:hypothetical protein